MEQVYHEIPVCRTRYLMTRISMIYGVTYVVLGCIAHIMFVRSAERTYEYVIVFIKNND